jgi:hypothetical protein
VRILVRLALAAAVVAVLPTAPADAVYCKDPLTEVCNTVCDVSQILDRPCLR